MMKITPDIVDTDSLPREPIIVKGRFVLDKHLFPVDEDVGEHWDLKITENDIITELSFWTDPSVGIGPFDLIKRRYYADLDEGTTTKTIDSGDVEICDEGNAVIMKFSGDRLGGKYKMYKVDNEWHMVRELEDTICSSDQSKMWIEVHKIDLPNNEIHGEIFGPNGKENVILGSLSHDVTTEIFNHYTKGSKILLVTLYKGYISGI